MGVLSKILKFVLDKDNQRFILLLLFIGSTIFAYSYRDKYKQQYAETQKQITNIEALGDSVRTYKNKAGELGSEKLALQSDKKQLKNLNEELSKELDKEKGTVNYLSKLVTNLQGEVGSVDSTSVEVVDNNTSPVGMSQYKFTWSKSNSGNKWSKILEGYFIIQADSSVKPTLIENKITKDNLSMEIITGVKTIDGKPTIFVRSTYPNLRFTNIDGAILDDKKLNTKQSRFGLGVSLGYGYDIKSSKFIPVIGFGVTYDLFRF